MTAQQHPPADTAQDLWHGPTCRGPCCLDPFRCNVAGACSLPALKPTRPWQWMNVGEEVIVPPDQAERAQIAVHNYLYNRRHSSGGGDDRHYITRNLPDGLHIWRTR